MTGLLEPPFTEGGTVPGLEGGNGEDEGGAVRIVEIVLPDMAGGEDTSAVDMMLTGAGDSEVGIVTGEAGSTGTVKPLEGEEAPWDVDASLATGSRDKFDTEVAVAVTPLGSDCAVVVVPVVVVTDVAAALVGGVDDVPVVFAAVVGGTEGGIDEGVTEEIEEEVMLAKVPLSIMARRV